MEPRIYNLAFSWKTCWRLFSSILNHPSVVNEWHNMWNLGKKLNKITPGGVTTELTIYLGYLDFFGVPQMVDFFGNLKIKIKNCCDRAICSLTCVGAKFGTKQKKMAPPPQTPLTPPHSPLSPPFTHRSVFRSSFRFLSVFLLFPLVCDSWWACGAHSRTPVAHPPRGILF